MRWWLAALAWRVAALFVLVRLSMTYIQYMRTYGTSHTYRHTTNFVHTCHAMPCRWLTIVQAIESNHSGLPLLVRSPFIWSLGGFRHMASSGEHTRCCEWLVQPSDHPAWTSFVPTNVEFSREENRSLKVPEHPWPVATLTCHARVPRVECIHPHTADGGQADHKRKLCFFTV